MCLCVCVYVCLCVCVFVSTGECVCKYMLRGYVFTGAHMVVSVFVYVLYVGEACVVMMCVCGGGMCCNDVCMWGRHVL